jgi:hypothetical protein
MGAGKGRARRAKAALAAPVTQQPARYDVLSQPGDVWDVIDRSDNNIVERFRAKEHGYTVAERAAYRFARELNENDTRAKVVGLSRSAWEDFVQSSELSRTSLYNYYLGKKPDTNVSSRAGEYEKLLTGLLLDAVDVGALTLPDGYDAKDFKFDMGLRTRYVGRATITHQRHKDITEECLFKTPTFRDNATLGTEAVKGELANIKDGLSRLIERIER